MTADGKIKNDMIRKYNQTDRFLDLVGGMFDGMNDITVVDCACGKSYLSFILNYYLWEQRHVRAKFIGIDIKPNVIEESGKIATDLGYNNMTFICEDLRTYDAPRADIITSIALGTPENLCAFCAGIQKGSPIDAYVTPEPWAMPGYGDPVIMAAGAFTMGASIELSADGPLREPYAVWLQGGLTWGTGKLGVLLAAQSMLDK